MNMQGQHLDCLLQQHVIRATTHLNLCLARKLMSFIAISYDVTIASHRHFSATTTEHGQYCKAKVQASTRPNLRAFVII